MMATLPAGHWTFREHFRLKDLHHQPLKSQWFLTQLTTVRSLNPCRKYKKGCQHHGSQDTLTGAHPSLAQLLWLCEVQIYLLSMSLLFLVWPVPLFTAPAAFVNSTKKYWLSHQDEAVNFPFRHLTIIVHNPGSNQRSLSLTGVQPTWLHQFRIQLPFLAGSLLLHSVEGCTRSFWDTFPSMDTKAGVLSPRNTDISDLVW